MKKIFILLFACCWLFTAPPAKAINDFNSAPTGFPVQCYCIYQRTNVIQGSSTTYDPTQNPNESFEENFSIIMQVPDPTKVSQAEQIAACKDEAIRKGLGANTQCSNEKLIQMTELKDDFKFTAPTLTIKIPGFSGFTAPPISWDKESGTVYFTWLGEYIKAIYNFGLVAISILAVIMIIVSGIRIIMSGLGGEKKEAYQHIIQAVIGLVLAWGSYTILYLINPNLTQFKGLAIKVVTPIDIKEIVDNDSDNGESIEFQISGAETCIPTSELYSIQNTVALGNVSYPYLQKEAHDALIKAVAEAKKQNTELLVTSAFRDVKTQKAIWEQAYAKMKKLMPEATDEEIIKQTRKYAAPPSCNSPHLTGRATDVCIKGSSTCGKLKVEYAKMQNMTADEKADVAKLKAIMKAAGWKNYTAEWWHYEYNCAVCPTVNRE